MADGEFQAVAGYVSDGALLSDEIDDMLGKKRGKGMNLESMYTNSTK